MNMIINIMIVAIIVTGCFGLSLAVMRWKGDRAKPWTDAIYWTMVAGLIAWVWL